MPSSWTVTQAVLDSKFQVSCWGCFVLVGKDIELDAVGASSNPTLTSNAGCVMMLPVAQWWCPSGVTWGAVRGIKPAANPCI